MFQFSGLALFRVIHLQCTRLSHSEIFGLMLVCSYPKLIAAYHVLHRLLVPRHPPYALIRFKYCHLLSSRVTEQCLFLSLLLVHQHCCQEQKLLSQYVKELTPYLINSRLSHLYEKGYCDVNGLEPFYRLYGYTWIITLLR